MRIDVTGDNGDPEPVRFAGGAQAPEIDEALLAYWASLDSDPRVQARMAEIDAYVATGKAPPDAVYPSEYFDQRRQRSSK